MPWTVVAALAVGFGAVAARSFTAQYVEGDDAGSVAYHVLGRNDELQEPYAPYHAGADLVLSLFGTDESTLRWAASLIGLLSAFAFAALALRLVYDWVGEGIGDAAPLLTGTRTAGAGAAIALTTLLAAPELLYYALVYLPSILGFAFMIGGHLVARRSVHRPDPVPGLALAAMLTGFGGAARWDLLLYGPIIAADLLFVQPGPATIWHHTSGPAQRFAAWLRSPLVKRVVGWGAASLLAWLAFISLAGHGLSDLGNGTAIATSGERSFAVIIAWTSPFFTPFLLLTAAVGLSRLPKARRTWVGAQMAWVVLVILLLRASAPKVFLIATPAFLLATVVGALHLWHHARATTLARTAMVVVLLVPWVVGVQFRLDDVAWGPGFELQPLDRAEGAGGTELSLTIGSGGALGTSEGPRSLWGHGAVLLGGQWRDFVDERADERADGLREAIDRDLPYIIVDGSNGYSTSHLVGMGLWPTSGVREEAALTHRQFRSDTSSDAITVIKLPGASSLIGDDPTTVDALRELLGDLGPVVATGYPSTMRDLYEHRPDAVTPLGVDAAVIDLDRLLAG